MKTIELSGGQIVEWPDEVVDEIQNARKQVLVDRHMAEYGRAEAILSALEELHRSGDRMEKGALLVHIADLIALHRIGP